MIVDSVPFLYRKSVINLQLFIWIVNIQCQATTCYRQKPRMDVGLRKNTKNSSWVASDYIQASKFMEKIGSKFQKLWSLVQGPRFARMPRNTLKRLKKQTLIRKIFLTLKRLLHLVNRKAPPITPIFFHKCNSSSKLVPNYQWK